MSKRYQPPPLATWDPQVHERIIALGFREAGRIDGKMRYTRDNVELRHADYGPNQYQPHAPDSNRHILQYYRDGRKRSGGTAWQAILARVTKDDATIAAQVIEAAERAHWEARDVITTGGKA